MSGTTDTTSETIENSEKQRRRIFLIEMSVGCILVVLFAAMALQSLQWPREAGVFPRLVAALGIVCTVLYMAQQWLLRRGRMIRGDERVLDIPWAKSNADADYVKRTAIISVLSMLGFWLGIVLVGFHVAAPVYIYSQLVLLGGLRHWQAWLGAITILLLVILVYGKLIGTTWNDPLLWDWARSWWTAAL